MNQTRQETLANCGEDRLVAELTRRLAIGKDVRVGVGDDCAVVGRPREARWQLLKTDAVIEGVHFQPGENLRRVGWKALCRAISDIAAMGGEPRHALVTIAVSPERRVAEVRSLYAGLQKAALRFGVSIVGGETARSPGPMFVNVALTGEVERQRCVLRSGGRPGDVLYVTGQLGGSIAGRHLDFIPRLTEARWLVKHFRIHAMMDLSDGLAADLPRLAAASRCSYEWREADIPRHRGCSLRQALSDGEDYELLFAVAAHDATPLERAWRKQFPKLRLTPIGLLNLHSTVRQPPTARGFDHFA